MRRRDAMIAIGTLAAASARARAQAWPVPTGRYVELAHGIDPAHPEPMEHGGATRTGRLAREIPVHEPSIAWARDSDPAARSRAREPVVARDGTIFVGTGQGLAALSLEGGEIFELAIGPLDASPVLLPGDELVAIARGGLAVRASRDGTVRANAELGFGVNEAPLVLDDGSLVVAGTDRTLRRIDLTFSERWRITLPAGPGRAPTRDGDRIAVAAGDELVSVSFEGEIERSIRLGGRVHGPAGRADDGTLWVALAEGGLVAITDRRRVRANVRLGNRLGTAERFAIARDGSLRMPLRQHGLVALGAGGGELWSIANEFPIDFPARVDPRGATLVIDRGPRLLAIEPDGTVRWRARLPTHVMSGPVVTRDGAIVCVAMEGSVIVLR